MFCCHLSVYRTASLNSKTASLNSKSASALEFGIIIIIGAITIQFDTIELSLWVYSTGSSYFTTAYVVVNDEF